MQDEQPVRVRIIKGHSREPWHWALQREKLRKYKTFTQGNFWTVLISYMNAPEQDHLLVFPHIGKRETVKAEYVYYQSLVPFWNWSSCLSWHLLVVNVIARLSHWPPPERVVSLTHFLRDCVQGTRTELIVYQMEFDKTKCSYPWNSDQN